MIDSEIITILDIYATRIQDIENRLDAITNQSSSHSFSSMHINLVKSKKTKCKCTIL